VLRFRILGGNLWTKFQNSLSESEGREDDAPECHGCFGDVCVILGPTYRPMGWELYANHYVSEANSYYANDWLELWPRTMRELQLY